MPFTITDAELVVGDISLTDKAGLPADDPITAASWTSADTTDAGTDVSVVYGDASSGTSDGDLTKVTVSATGTGEGDVSITGTLTTASGATVTVTDTGTVNGGAAVSGSVAWGAPAAKP
jgi:hypothetical protein